MQHFFPEAPLSAAPNTILFQQNLKMTKCTYNTVFLSNLSYQRDSTVPHRTAPYRTVPHRTATHYTICDRILKKYYRYIVRDIYRCIYRNFLSRYKDRYIDRYIKL